MAFSRNGIRKLAHLFDHTNEVDGASLLHVIFPSAKDEGFRYSNEKVDDVWNDPGPRRNLTFERAVISLLNEFNLKFMRGC